MWTIRKVHPILLCYVSHYNYHMLWALFDHKDFTCCWHINSTPGPKRRWSSSAHQDFGAANKVSAPILATICSLILKKMVLKKWLFRHIVLTFPFLSHVPLFPAALCMSFSLLFRWHQKKPFPLNGPLALLGLCQKPLLTSHLAISLICFKANKIK